MGVETSLPIKAGQELYAYYGYKRIAFPYDFPWYWKLKKQTEKEDRVQKEELLKSTSTAKSDLRQYKEI